MTRELLLLSSLLSITLAIGCHRKSAGSQIAINRAQATKGYSEAELDKLITPGMSLAEVTNKFGLPGSAIQITESMIHLSYSFPFEVKKPEEGPYMTGFGIDIKDGRVLRWSPITGMTGKRIDGGASQGAFGEQSFQIFLATDDLANIVNAVESSGSADATGLKSSPEMTFKAKVFAGKSGDEPSGEMTVILVMNDQDAWKLKDLTENNVGKRTLLVCRNKVIATPSIMEPITSKRFTFTVKNSHVLDSLLSK